MSSVIREGEGSLSLLGWREGVDGFVSNVTLEESSI